MDFVEMHRRKLKEFIDWKRDFLKTVEEEGDKKHAEVIKRQLEALERFLGELEILKVSKDRFAWELRKLQEIEERLNSLKGAKKGPAVLLEIKRLERERERFKSKVEEKIGEKIEEVEGEMRKDFGEDLASALLLLDNIKVGENPLSAPNKIPADKKIELVRKLYEKGYIGAGADGKIKLTERGKKALAVAKVINLKEKRK